MKRQLALICFALGSARRRAGRSFALGFALALVTFTFTAVLFLTEALRREFRLAVATLPDLTVQQLALERQAELVASVMQVALILEVLGLGLSVLVADHLAGGIRGAMCAFGVLASTRAGFAGLLVSLLTAVVCGLWMILHRFDLYLETPVLTHRKFAWLLPVGALALADLALTVALFGNWTSRSSPRAARSGLTQRR